MTKNRKIQIAIYILFILCSCLGIFEFGLYMVGYRAGVMLNPIEIKANPIHLVDTLIDTPILEADQDGLYM